jgi:hypothetical protein
MQKEIRIRYCFYVIKLYARARARVCVCVCVPEGEEVLFSSCRSKHLMMDVFRRKHHIVHVTVPPSKPFSSIKRKTDEEGHVCSRQVEGVIIFLKLKDNFVRYLPTGSQ